MGAFEQHLQIWWSLQAFSGPICQAYLQACCPIQLCHISLIQDGCSRATVVSPWSLPPFWGLSWLSMQDCFYFLGFHFFVFQMTRKKSRVLSFTFTSQYAGDIYYQYLFLYSPEKENGCSHTEGIEETPTTVYCHIR